jgi:5'-nucleotidase
MLILLTNDDGIDSPGLLAIKKELEKLGEVWAFATWEDKSGSGHSITITQAIRVAKVGDRTFKVDGNPADCVNIAVNGILEDIPDIVVSGINLGENVGDYILYSGTFGGAMEGALLGITSFAVSARAKEGKTGDLEVVAKMTRKMIEFFLENPPPKRVVININFPFFRHAKEIKGVKFGKLSQAAYGERAIHFQDPRGRDFWFLGSKELKVNSDGVENLKELDYFILEDGFICITPVKIELPILNIFDEKELSTLSSLVMKEASLLEVNREEP